MTQNAVLHEPRLGQEAVVRNYRPPFRGYHLLVNEHAGQVFEMTDKERMRREDKQEQWRPQRYRLSFG